MRLHVRGCKEKKPWTRSCSSQSTLLGSCCCRGGGRMLRQNILPPNIPYRQPCLLQQNCLTFVIVALAVRNPLFLPDTKPQVNASFKIASPPLIPTSLHPPSTVLPCRRGLSASCYGQVNFREMFCYNIPVSPSSLALGHIYTHPAVPMAQLLVLVLAILLLRLPPLSMPLNIPWKSCGMSVSLHTLTLARRPRQSASSS